MLTFLNRMRLSNRLNLIVLFLNISILVVVAWLAALSSDAALRNAALERFYLKNQDASDNLDEIFQNLFDTTVAISSRLSEVEDLNDSAALRAFLVEYVAADNDNLIHRINIVREDKSVAVLYMPNPRQPDDYTWRVYRQNSFPNLEGLTDARTERVTRWFRQSQALYDSEERRTISLAIPYDHPQFDGVLWIDIPLNVIEEQMRIILNSEGLLAETVKGYALLLDANSNVIASLNLPDDADLGRTARNLTADLEKARRNSDNLYDLRDPYNDNANNLFSYSRFPSNEWHFITVLPKDEIPELPSVIFVPIIAVATVGVLSLYMVVRWFISNAVVKPLLDLQRSASEIGEGNLRFVVFHLDKRDEIGELASAMESMKNRLRESYDALQKWSRTLEKRVDERTEQLAVAQKRAETTAQQLQAIYDESLSVVNEAQLRPVLDKFMYRIMSLLDATFVSIWLGTQDDESLQLVATNDPHPNSTGHALTIARNEGIVGQTIMQESPIIIEDYDNYPHRIRTGEYYGGKAAINRAMCVPLVFAGHAIGAVVVGRPLDSPNFDANDTLQLALFSNLVSPSVRNAQLFVQLREAVNEAERANEVKTRFLASVTHELRTPLNLIINNMDFMRVGAFGEVSDEQVSRLNQTVRSAEHLLYLINDLLDVSKIEAGEMQLFIQQNDVYTMLEDTVDNAYALLETYEGKEDIELHVDIEEGLPELPMDTRRIRQVLNNLLSNAIKFTKEGAVSLKVFKSEVGVHFSVHDTGIGIPEDEMPKLFQAFERTKVAKESNIEGTGLGLPISRFMVQQHGTDLTVVSEAGIGTTFAFTLPFELPEMNDGKPTSTQQVTAILSSKNE